MDSSTKLLFAFTWLLMISSCYGPPLHSTPSPSGFHELDGSIGFKCSSNKIIGVHMVCDKKRDCMDHSDEIYCIHQSVPFKANGTFGNGEKICTQVDDKCSCVQVTVTLGEDGEELYELLKSIVEENVTADSNENITEKPIVEENVTSKSNENITEQSTIEENFTSNGNENITEQPIVEENSTYKSNKNIIEKPIVENPTSKNNITFLEIAGLSVLSIVVVDVIAVVFIYFKYFRKPKTDTPIQQGEEIELQNIGTAEETHEEAERFLANQPVESNV